MGVTGWVNRMMFPKQYRTAALAALTLCALATPGAGQTHVHAARITCTNPSSGATWEIDIDYDQATVDRNAARLSSTEITWRDGKDGGHYSLDLRSGELTVTVASSTGGYFLHDRCDLPR